MNIDLVSISVPEIHRHFWSVTLTDATLYPRDKAIQRQDKFALTVGYKGGLSGQALVKR